MPTKDQDVGTAGRHCAVHRVSFDLSIGDCAEFVQQFCPDVAIIMGRDAVIRYVGDSVERLSGWTPEDLVGRSAADLIHSDDLEYTVGMIFEADVNPGSHGAVEIRLLCADGTWLRTEIQTYNPPDDPEGRLVLSIRDISNRSALPERRRALEQFSLWVGATCASVSVGDLDEAMGSITSRLGTLVNADEVSMSVLPEDRSSVDSWQWTRVGALRRLAHPISADAVEESAAAVDHPSRLRVHLADEPLALVEQPVLDDTGAIGILSLCWHHPDARRHWDEGNGLLLEAAARIISMTARRVHRERDLAHRALHDPLTELGNRSCLLTALDQELNRLSGRNASGLAVAFCDLDRFKHINDTWGHEAGDEVLVGIADRLRDSVRHGDLVCRVGGDEFVVLCPAVDDAELAQDLGQRIAEQVAVPIELADGHEVSVRASIGLVLVTGQANGPVQPSDLLRVADAAMYGAKARPDRGLVFSELDLNDLS